MVTTLYLIRHGETEGAEVRRYKGSIDVPLSKKGIEQMKRVSKFLNRSYKSYASYMPYKKSLSAVYCSDLSRAINSAGIISEQHGLKPVIIPGFRERNFGIWEGMSFDEIREKYPAEFDSWANNPLKFSPMGGESTLQVRDRVINALDNILKNHHPTPPSPSRGEGKGGGESIVIVSHGGVNRIILCHILGIPLENIFRVEQDYAAVNIIEFWDKYPIVKLINGAVNG